MFWTILFNLPILLRFASCQWLNLRFFLPGTFVHFNFVYFIWLSGVCRTFLTTWTGYLLIRKLFLEENSANYGSTLRLRQFPCFFDQAECRYITARSTRKSKDHVLLNWMGEICGRSLSELTTICLQHEITSNTSCSSLVLNFWRSSSTVWPRTGLSVSHLYNDVICGI